MAGRCRTLRRTPKSVGSSAERASGRAQPQSSSLGAPAALTPGFRTGVRLSGVLIPQVTSALDRVVAM